MILISCKKKSLLCFWEQWTMNPFLMEKHAWKILVKEYYEFIRILKLVLKEPIGDGQCHGEWLLNNKVGDILNHSSTPLNFSSILKLKFTRKLICSILIDWYKFLFSISLTLWFMLDVALYFLWLLNKRNSSKPKNFKPNNGCTKRNHQELKNRKENE